MTEAPAARAPRISVKSGTVLVVGLVLIFGIGWFVYRLGIPPAWLRSFGEEIALHAAPDPNAPPPEDTRQQTPRGLTSSPYICVARAIHEPWDRLVVVPAGADAQEQPTLAAARWPNDKALASFAQKLKGDPRYQGLVLLEGGRVTESAMFFTFWGDLTQLARPEGFTRADAIFTAKVENGAYRVSVPAEVPADACD